MLRVVIPDSRASSSMVIPGPASIPEGYTCIGDINRCKVRPMIAAAEWGWSAWAWLIIPLAVYGLTSLTLFAFGRTDETNPLKFFFGQIGDTLERITGYPGWSMAGTLSGLIMLLVVVIGFYWDVAWHIDNGRDD